MRWSELFDDLEAQLADERTRELSLEVADRVRREWGTLTLSDRLVGAAGTAVTLWVPGKGACRGLLQEVGKDWAMLSAAGAGADVATGTTTVIPLAAVHRIDGLGHRADDRPGASMRRFALGYALRALSRDRVTVRVTDRDGGQAVGTIDRVGADHLDLAEHSPDLPRRREHVRLVRVIPFEALACVSS